MSLGDYQIIKQLGSGTYSVVYEVLDKEANQHFAMKEIKFDRLSSKEKEYTNTEVRILKEIQHPNLIKFEKSFLAGSNFYIIMELATEGDLQKKIQSYEEKHQNFPIETIWRFTYQIVLGLQALHDNKILHRDIKASNIFIMQDGKVKIGDFNIGKELSETTMCTKIGTPVMMSPEIWNGEPYNSKTDIWSLGCLVYHMAALKPPFVAESYAALYMKISKNKVPQLLNYPKSLNKFIQSLLKKNPKLRPTCAEILKFKEIKTVCEPNLHLKALSLVRDTSKELISSRKHHKSVFFPSFNPKICKNDGAVYLKDLVPLVPLQKKFKSSSPQPEIKHPNHLPAERLSKDYLNKLTTGSHKDKQKSSNEKIFYYKDLGNPYSAIFNNNRIKTVTKKRTRKNCVSFLCGSNSVAKRSGSNLKSATPSFSPKPLKKIESLSKLYP